MKTLVCAALSCALLLTPALAAEPESGVSSQAPTGTASYQLPEQLGWIYRWGSASELSGDSVLLHAGGETEQDILYHISDQTVILNAVTGEPMTADQLRDGESLYIYSTPVMTLSEPAQAGATLILASIPADYGVPMARRVTSVTRDGDSVSIGTEDLVYHLSDETKISGLSLDELIPGDYVVGWYDMVAESYPAQTTPETLILLDGGNAGWIHADLQSVSLNGAELELSEQELPQLQEGKLMLPVRAVAEELGCTVSWDAQSPDQVTVSQDGQTLYTLALDGEEAYAASGVSFAPVEQILGVHNLYFVP